MLGTDRVRFEVCSLTLPAGQTCDDPSPTLRSFDRISDAAAENGESRILVGFHFRHAVVDGIAHGRTIGNWTVSHYMEPVTADSIGTYAMARCRGGGAGRAGHRRQ